MNKHIIAAPCNFLIKKHGTKGYGGSGRLLYGKMMISPWFVLLKINCLVYISWFCVQTGSRL